MHLLARLFQAGQRQQLAPGCAGADENRVVLLVEDFLETGHLGVEEGHHTHVEDVVDFLVEHFPGQAEGGNLAAHHAAAGILVVIDVDAVAQGHQVAGDRQRCRTGTDQGDALAVLLLGNLRQTGANIGLVVRGDPLETADGHRLLVLGEASAATGRLTGTVAGAAQNPGEYVGFPVDHVGVVVAARGNQPDVLGHGGMRRAGVLTIDDLVEVLGVCNIGRFHCSGLWAPTWNGVPASGHRQPQILSHLTRLCIREIRKIGPFFIQLQVIHRPRGDFLNCFRTNRTNRPGVAVLPRNWPAGCGSAATDR